LKWETRNDIVELEKPLSLIEENLGENKKSLCLGRLRRGDEKLKPNLIIKNKINNFQH